MLGGTVLGGTVLGGIVLGGIVLGGTVLERHERGIHILWRGRIVTARAQAADRSVKKGFLPAMYMSRGSTL